MLMNFKKAYYIHRKQDQDDSWLQSKKCKQEDSGETSTSTETKSTWT